METTLLGLALPGVLYQIKQLLIRQGFIVQTMPTANPVLIAYKEGSWLRNPKKLIIEITSEAENITKLDITAILSEKKSSRHMEEVIEENLVAKLNNIFKKSNKKTIWDLTR